MNNPHTQLTGIEAKAKAALNDMSAEPTETWTRFTHSHAHILNEIQEAGLRTAWCFFPFFSTESG
jgi:hypothetical protein